MKKLVSLLFAAIVLAAAVTSCYDDTKIQKDLQDLEARVAALEEMMKTANANIVSLQAVVGALEGKVYVTNVTDNGGSYTFTFADGSTVTIKDGEIPAIGLKQEGGVYYWTLNGTWLLDGNGKKVSASGTTPQFKIEGGYWYISCDNGATWTQLSPATGEPGAMGPQGEPGPQGDPGPVAMDIQWDDHFVYIILPDNTQITLPMELGAGLATEVKLVPVPDLANGAVIASSFYFPIKFNVLPWEMTEHLATLGANAYEVNVLYTMTKSAPGTYTKLPIVSVDVYTEEDYIELYVDGASLSEDFLSGRLDATAILFVNDGENSYSSNYFPLYSGPVAVDLGLSVKWASCNVGAWQVHEYGDYFAWAETHSKGWFGWANYKWCEYGTNAAGANSDPWLTKYNYNSSVGIVDDCWSFSDYGLEDDPAYAQWGGQWRTPTMDEFQELVSQCAWAWVDDYNGTKGYIVMGTTGNFIYLPAAGYKFDYVDDLNESLFYWASDLNGYYHAYELVAGPYYGDPYIGYDNRYFGQSIRPVTDGWDNN